MGLSIGMSRCDLFLDEEDEEDDREEWGGEWASVLDEARDEEQEVPEPCDQAVELGICNRVFSHFLASRTVSRIAPGLTEIALLGSLSPLKKRGTCFPEPV